MDQHCNADGLRNVTDSQRTRRGLSDVWLVVGTRWKVLRGLHHLTIIPDFEHERHSNLNVIIDMAMEQPESRIVSEESDDRESAVWNGNGVFDWRPEQATSNLPTFIQLNHLEFKIIN